MGAGERGFEEWYRAEHPRVLASLTLLGGDVDVARDATDEAFARALDRWDRVSGMAAPGGWTYRVALNVMRRKLRRAAIERRLWSREPRPPDIPAPAVELWDLVRALPDRQRRAVVLRYVADLPEAEIAAAMGVARGTVSATLAAARARLNEMVTSDQTLTLEAPRA